MEFLIIKEGNVPGTIAVEWSEFGRLLKKDPFEAALDVGFYLMEKECVVVDDPMFKHSIITGDSLHQVLKLIIEYVNEYHI